MRKREEARGERGKRGRERGRSQLTLLEHPASCSLLPLGIRGREPRAMDGLDGCYTVETIECYIILKRPNKSCSNLPPSYQKYLSYHIPYRLEWLLSLDPSFPGDTPRPRPSRCVFAITRIPQPTTTRSSTGLPVLGATEHPH